MFQSRRNPAMSLLFFVLIQAIPDGHGADRVKVWEGPLTIRTYPWYQDVNPKFTPFTGKRIYPYTQEDMLSEEAVDVEYGAVFLENEFLRVTVLPELGGHVHSVFDKSTNEETFYLNDVVKPGLVGLRGAWIPGGVEFNTGPTGHTATCTSPIDARPIEHDDGSASVTVGHVERIFRTQWAAVLTLRPGKAYLEERIRMFNPRETPQPYYFWNCTAVPNTDGMRFMYPMTLGTDHNGTSFYSWPVHEGKDMSWSKSYQDMSSIFAQECDQDFFGSYDYDLDRGVVAFADHRLLPGKKAWTWGRGQIGVLHQGAMSDGDGFYNEIQTGPLRTQADFGLIPPHGVVTWEEWWYPVHGLQGFEYANRDAAINVTDSPNGRIVKLLGTGIWKNSRVSIVAGTQKTTRVVDLSPREPTEIVVNELDSSLPWTITVTGERNEPLASFTYPLPLPLITEPEAKPTPPENSAHATYSQGVSALKQNNPESARKQFLAALEQDSHDVGSLVELAMLDLEAGDWREAASYAGAAVERYEDHGGAQLAYSEALLQLGDPERALDHAYWAMRDEKTRARGFAQAGRIATRRGRYDQAIRQLRRALEVNSETLVSRNRLALALLAKEENEEAAQVATGILEIDPIDRLAVTTLAFAEPSAKHLRMRSAVLRNNAQNVLEVAYALVDLRFPERALQILNEAYLETIELDTLPPARSWSQNPKPYAKQPETPLEPMALYLAAYLHQVVGETREAAEWYRRAAAYAPDFSFPYRVDSVPVLQAAVRQNPSDAQASRMHGHLLASLGKMEEAREAWAKASENDPRDSVSLACLAQACWKLDDNLDAAATLYERAITARQEDPVLLRDAARVYTKNKQFANARRHLEAAVQLERKRGDCFEELCRRYLDDGDPRLVVALLKTTTFSNQEARRVIHNLFAEAHRTLAKETYEAKQYGKTIEHAQAAMTYPENLGVGRLSEPNEAREYLWIGKAHLAMGNKAEAKKALTKAVSFSQEDDEDIAKAAREASELLK